MNGIYGISKVSFPAVIKFEGAPKNSPLNGEKSGIFYNKEHLYGFLQFIGEWGETRKLLQRDAGHFDYIKNGEHLATVVIVALGRGAHV
ncbi:hypothetical protein BdPhPhi1402_gp03 [Bdellovibrio phage phi1402]|uniref:hypothetical protein n=1 Tax=Bdellovibrio phage phi1402 TaxID=1035662 RepID=UPI000211A2C1|nr:hypothetical protein BdPhPhi1402_gp03 [Bdellovibrio phage phi1402]AEG42300.1 hypothetical protein [Bdellovibrio phage phi1402]